MSDDGRNQVHATARARATAHGRTHALKLMVLLFTVMVTGALLTSSLVADPQARTTDDEAEEMPEYVPANDAESEVIDVSRLPRVSDEMTAAPVMAPTFRRSRVRERR